MPDPPPARSLTIGIDARAATEVRAGRGRVVRELLRELARRPEQHRYRCYTRQPWDGVSDARLEWVLVDAGDPLWNLRVARLASRECDVFLSTNSYLTTWFLAIPGVPIVYDLVAFDPAMRPNRRSALIEWLTIGLAVRRSAAFVAISATTARALADRYPAAASRTTTALLGVAPTLEAAPGAFQTDCPGHDPAEVAGLPERDFVLAVGTLEPRKNLPRLVDAYRRLPADLQRRHPLVVVGARGWQTGETMRALDSLGDRAIALGHVSDAALHEAYRRCAVFCYPSLGEGFGLPVLEAMAAGAPVLTSSVSSLPEVGGDAVAYADPTDVAAIADALLQLLGDAPRRAELARRGRLRAAEFSWASFAERVLGTLEVAAGASAHGVPCPLCGAGSTFRLRSRDRNRRVDDEPFDYRRCQTCDVLFLANPPRELGRYYPPSYYSDAGSNEPTELAKLDFATRHAPGGGRLIEVGPGGGGFSLAARDAGYDVTAVEMDEAAGVRLRSRGVPVIHSDQPEHALQALGPARVVALWHVIEHVSRPVETLEAAAAALEPGGVVIVATPNPDSLQTRVLRGRAPHLDAPRHLFLIPPSLLTAWARDAGLEPVELTFADRTGRDWNAFGWQAAMLRPETGPRWRRISFKLGAALALTLAPYERRGFNGSTYTAVFRRSER
ncbi:MAG TPA: glycosyltransferase [Solirubrobacteraceae bacterium]|nr:glycosyltransferase [Solirubrobacteraceae bacterium]